jgi:hypothetical protein
MLYETKGLRSKARLFSESAKYVPKQRKSLSPIYSNA